MQISVTRFYALHYTAVDNYQERRAPFRAAHLDLIRRGHAAGSIVMAGALGDPAEGALIVFRSSDEAEAFAREDPYVLNGLITEWTVRVWQVVAGA